jgi:hypothetical protein
MGYYEVGFDSRFNTNQIWNFSRCSYAVLLEAAEFNFSTAYIDTTKFNDTGIGRVPVDRGDGLGDKKWGDVV